MSSSLSETAYIGASAFPHPKQFDPKTEPQEYAANHVFLPYKACFHAYK